MYFCPSRKIGTQKISQIGSLREGYVAPDQLVTLVDRPYPQWTIARANEIMHQHLIDRELAASLVGNVSRLNTSIEYNDRQL